MAGSILPPNSTPTERKIETLGAHVRDLPVSIRDLWNPATCPVAFLPWLAWALSVDTWRSDWSEETKRAVVAASPRVHRLKGTVAAVKSAIAAVSGLSPSRLIEWFEDEGTGERFTAIAEVDITEVAGTVHSRAELPRDLIAATDASRPVRSRVAIRLLSRPSTAIVAAGVIQSPMTRGAAAGVVAYARPFRAGTRAAAHLRTPLTVARIDMDGAIVRPLTPAGLRTASLLRKPITLARLTGDGRTIRFQSAELRMAANLRTPATFARIAAQGA